jgi:deoxyribodipyrimidine photo-lyase
MSKYSGISVCWFRRDLRLDDQAALFHALTGPFPVLPLFIFDDNILNQLDNKADKRVDLIHQMLENLHMNLKLNGSGMMIRKGNPAEIFYSLISAFNIRGVYTNHDYEPYAIQRDDEISNLLQSHNIPFYTFKDQVIFEKNEILKPDNQPYTIFTPYAKKWKEKLNSSVLKNYPSEKYQENFLKNSDDNFYGLIETEFPGTGVKFESPVIQHNIIENYEETRNFPAIAGTSQLSYHLRFGTISIRKVVKSAMEINESWLNELIWREFFMMILWHYPGVAKQAFKKKYEEIRWRYDESEFRKWSEGKTGYALVDAGMRELNETGMMHNRIRMIATNFFTKIMLHDWRIGEAYFASRLLDYDLSANNGNWQWSAGCGCDAAPYFRIFNPDEQIRKFDPEHKYIKRWIPEWGSPDYPEKMSDYKTCRTRALEEFKRIFQ